MQRTLRYFLANIVHSGGENCTFWWEIGTLCVEENQSQIFVCGKKWQLSGMPCLEFSFDMLAVFCLIKWVRFIATVLWQTYRGKSVQWLWLKVDENSGIVRVEGCAGPSLDTGQEFCIACPVKASTNTETIFFFIHLKLKIKHHILDFHVSNLKCRVFLLGSKR